MAGHFPASTPGKDPPQGVASQDQTPVMHVQLGGAQDASAIT
jgi:hypothetical protein